MHISDLFGREYKKPPIKTNRSERGDLLAYFAEKVNRSRVADGFKPQKISYFAYFLSHINVRDLYFLRSICDDAVKRGFRFDVTFWKAVKERTKPSPKFRRNGGNRSEPTPEE